MIDFQHHAVSTRFPLACIDADGMPGTIPTRLNGVFREGGIYDVTFGTVPGAFNVKGYYLGGGRILQF